MTATPVGPSGKRIVHWAHQGGAKEGPSNTLLAFERAVALKDPDLGFELDVHRSADEDSVLIVIHDRTLERTTNGHGRVRRHRWTNLQRLDAAHRWIAENPGDVSIPVGLPTLDAVLGYWKKVQPLPPMTIEIKDRRAVEPLLEKLANDTSVEDRARITVTSFNDLILWRLRYRLWRLYTPSFVGLAPGTAYILAFWVLTALSITPRTSRYSRLQIPIRLGRLAFATPRLVATAHRTRIRKSARTGSEERLAVDVWTVDDVCDMRDLAVLGVDGIMTDLPSALRTVLGTGP